MSLLVDLFGYLSIIIHGLTIVAQSMTLGGVFFLVFLARPQARLVGPAGDAILHDTVRIAAYAALGLILCEAATGRVIGERFWRMSMIGVSCIVVSGAVMSVFYIGSRQGFYGTAYGVMVGAKIAMFLMLLALGYGNYRTVARLRTDPDSSVNR